MATVTDRRRAEVLDLLQSLLPAADAATLHQALVDAVATQPGPLREMVDHLRAHPDALISGSPRCPGAWVRLTHVLHAAGHTHVARPGCAGCGALTPRLRWLSPAGRICARCFNQSQRPRRRCSRCQQIGVIQLRRPDGDICVACYDRDRQHQRQHRREPCGQCGRLARVAAHAADGSPRCRGCHGRRLVVCHGCGQKRQPRKITDDGAFCAACYLPGHRTCGRCGRRRAIVKRADTTGPDLCESCYHGADAICVHCGRQRPCQRIASGAPICRSCQYRRRPAHACARCGRTQKIQARWPIGPVCGACYLHVRKHPEPCDRCGTLAPAIGRGPDDEPWCAACAGARVDYTCHRCGAHGVNHTDHRCFRCSLTHHATDLLTGPDGQIKTQLQPLLNALVAVDNPESTLIWVNGGAAARLLGELAVSDQPLTHDLLDTYPPSNAVHHLREILISAGILPSRDEHLARLTSWITTTLATIPAHQAQYVTPFAHWYVLRRARRHAAHTPLRHTAADYARATIRRALQLLTWLDQHHTPLPELTQPMLELWIEQVTSSDQIRPFLRWLRNRALIGDVRFPATNRDQPVLFLSDDDRIAQLDRCLHDQTIPLDVRVAGAIALLYGIMIERIVYLTKEQVNDTNAGTFLGMGDHQLLLPPALAHLTRQLRDRTPPQGALARINTPSPWLFVGRATSRPIHPSYLSAKLTRHGLHVHAGRNTARLALAAELPAPVLAEMTGTSIESAADWTAWAKRDWNDYVASRITTNTAPFE